MNFFCIFYYVMLYINGEYDVFIDVVFIVFLLKDI